MRKTQKGARLSCSKTSAFKRHGYPLPPEAAARATEPE